MEVERAVLDDTSDFWLELLGVAVGMMGREVWGWPLGEGDVELSWNMLRPAAWGHGGGCVHGAVVYWAPAMFEALCLALEHMSHLL